MEMEFIHRQEELEHAELERALQLSLAMEEQRLRSLMADEKATDDADAAASTSTGAPTNADDAKVFPILLISYTLIFYYLCFVRVLIVSLQIVLKILTLKKWLDRIISPPFKLTVSSQHPNPNHYDRLKVTLNHYLLYARHYLQ